MVMGSSSSALAHAVAINPNHLFSLRIFRPTEDQNNQRLEALSFNIGRHMEEFIKSLVHARSAVLSCLRGGKSITAFIVGRHPNT